MLASNNLLDCSTVLQQHARINCNLTFDPIRNGHGVKEKALPVCTCAPLCTTLKDHNNHFMQTKVDMSFSHSLQLVQDQLVEEPLESVHASERVVRLQVVWSLFSAKLRDKLIPSLISSCLQMCLAQRYATRPQKSKKAFDRQLS